MILATLRGAFPHVTIIGEEEEEEEEGAGEWAGVKARCEDVYGLTFADEELHETLARVTNEFAGLGFMVQDLGCWAQSFGFRV